MTCRKCSVQLPEDAVFCHLCGVKQAKPASRPRTRANGLGTAYKRGKTWTAQLRKQVQEDGKTRQITLTRGGFATRAEALAAAPLLIGAPVQSHERTLAYYWDLYQSGKMEKLSDSKRTAYIIAYKKLKAIQHQPIRQLSVKQLQRVIDKEAPTYYPARDMRTLLSHLYRYAMVDGEVLSNPAVVLELPSLNEKESEAFTDKEQQALWNRYNAGDTFVGYILLMIYTGMMPGELLACRKEHIRWDDHQIIGSGMKTSYRRDTPITVADFMLPVLRKLCDFSKGLKLVTMNKDNFYTEYYAALERAGTRRLPPYSCRHTTGTKLELDQGAAPSVIAKVLRQKTQHVQQRYKHPDLQDAKKAVDALRPD